MNDHGYPVISCHSTPIVAVGWSPFDEWAEGEMVKRISQWHVDEARFIPADEVRALEDLLGVSGTTGDDGEAWLDAAEAVNRPFNRDDYRDGLFMWNGKWVNMDRFSDEELGRMARGLAPGDDDMGWREP